jgi:hypothetical protein
MRRTEPLRLILLGLLVIFIQLAWYLAFPSTRAALDLYALFLLLATAATGPLLGGILALTGGVLMDLYGAGFGAFHCFYYLLPVAIGSHLRAHMLTEFRLLGTFAAVGLILVKIAAQLVFLLATNKIHSIAPLFQLNYWPLVIVALIVYFFWPKLVSQFPMPSKVRDGR